MTLEAIIWYGLGTWSTVQRVCSRRATSPLRSGRSCTSPSASSRMAAFHRTSGSMVSLDGGIQLDEVAFPILLAFRLRRENALLDFDPYPMVRGAASYLVNHGPATQQERWEECAGYSPSTLASNIAALICAACFCRERGEEATATFLEEYADFLESHLEEWTTTTEGSLGT